MSDRIKVIFILGAGRSGSTLVDMALGQVEGVSSTGGLFKACRKNAICSCGREVHNDHKAW